MTIKPHTRFYEDSERPSRTKRYMLVFSNGHPVLLNDHAWFFDTKFIEGDYLRVANKELKDRDMEIKDISYQGRLVDNALKGKKSVTVDNREDFTSLFNYITKNVTPTKTAKQDKQSEQPTKQAQPTKRKLPEIKPEFPMPGYEPSFNDIVAARKKKGLSRLYSNESKHRELEARIKRLEKLILDE